MDTPGHVSEKDGQEKDENKWGVAAGGEEKRLAKQRIPVQEKTQTSGAEHEHERAECVLEIVSSLKSPGTDCTALHVTYGIHT